MDSLFLKRVPTVPTKLAVYFFCQFWWILLIPINKCKRKISQKVMQIDTARSRYFSQWESIMLSTSWEVGGSFQKLYFVRDLTTIPITVVFAMSCTNSNSLSKSISVPYIMSRNWVLFSEFNWHQIHPIKFYCLFYLL